MRLAVNAELRLTPGAIRSPMHREDGPSCQSLVGSPAHPTRLGRAAVAKIWTIVAEAVLSQPKHHDDVVRRYLEVDPLAERNLAIVEKVPGPDHHCAVGCVLHELAALGALRGAGSQTRRRQRP
jgi:hypothetical protein